MTTEITYAEYTRRRTAEWRQAIDLVISGRAVELVALVPNFLVPADTVFGAIGFALRHSPHDQPARKGYITTQQAREILSGIDSEQPDDDTHLLPMFREPMECKPDNVAYWGISPGSTQHREDYAWGLILGIERGWFKYDHSGFLQWSARGRDLYAGGLSTSFVESATGQSAFSF